MSEASIRTGTRPLHHSIGCYNKSSATPAAHDNGSQAVRLSRGQRVLPHGASVGELDSNAPPGTYVNLFA